MPRTTNADDARSAEELSADRAAIELLHTLLPSDAIRSSVRAVLTGDVALQEFSGALADPAVLAKALGIDSSAFDRDLRKAFDEWKATHREADLVAKREEEENRTARQRLVQHWVNGWLRALDVWQDPVRLSSSTLHVERPGDSGRAWDDWIASRKRAVNALLAGTALRRKDFELKIETAFAVNVMSALSTHSIVLPDRAQLELRNDRPYVVSRN